MDKLLVGMAMQKEAIVAGGEGGESTPMKAISEDRIRFILETKRSNLGNTKGELYILIDRFEEHTILSFWRIELDKLESTLAENIEEQRNYFSKNTALKHKENYGQYFTPYSIAKFMASLFPEPDTNISLLDPGAGVGSLACAFVQDMQQRGKQIQFQVDCIEFDARVLPELQSNMLNLQDTSAIEYRVINEDFVHYAVDYILSFNKPFYTHVILNPPYKKIHSESVYRKLTRLVDMEIVNLYAAFVSLSLELLRENGYLVAIIPRSFCNGVYYQPFRKHILNNAVIKHIHLFESRKSVFKDDRVLQENVILMLQKSDFKGDVVVSYSDNSDLRESNRVIFDYKSIVDMDSSEKIINIPLPTVYFSTQFRTPLDKLCIKLSTGPVVDFRNRDYLRQVFNESCAPLLYPQHINSFEIYWPAFHENKPDAIIVCEETSKMMYKNGYYVVVRRFSSKEEKRRIVAAIVKPSDFKSDFIAFENHLNVFHDNGSGLEEDFAYGLLCYLNTVGFDNQFRVFSGHTQVNAGDLRRMVYPEKSRLEIIGQQAKSLKLTYETIEELVKRYGVHEREPSKEN